MKPQREPIALRGLSGLQPADTRATGFARSPRPDMTVSENNRGPPRGTARPAGRLTRRRKDVGMPIDFDSEESDPHQEIRAGVRKLCAQFPGEYWRRLDREAAYPADFVKAVTAAGYLSALIPEEFGGSGLPL